MRQVSPGKFRALSRASSAGGHFNVLALDHTDALKRALNPDSPQSVTDDHVIVFKRQVVTALAPETSGVLLDPIYGAPQAIHDKNLGCAGLLVELEKADYQLQPMPLEGEILPGWNVTKIKQMGAEGVKLFFYYNPDSAELTIKQDALLRKVVADCTAHDIPLYAEPILCGIGEDKSVYAKEFTRRVIETARRVAAMGADILKLEYPVHSTQITDAERCRDACAELSASLDIPWVLLSAGVSFDIFRHQVYVACKAGASGCIVGRAVWGEVARIADERQRQSWLDSVGRDRMRELATCVPVGNPWTNQVECEPISTNWYQTYGDGHI